MAFTFNSNFIALNSSILRANCQTLAGGILLSTLDLDKVFGSSGGKFIVGGSGFFSNSQNVKLVNNSILKAELKKADGSFAEASLDLNLCIENNNGKLEFHAPRESLLQSTASYLLEGSILKAVCFGKNGKMDSSQIDLNLHYGNHDGKFASGFSGFADTSQKLSLSISPTGIVLQGELKRVDGSFVSAEVNLPICIINRVGELVFVKKPDDGSFDTSGAFPDFFERRNIPFALGTALRFGRDSAEGDRDTIYSSGSDRILTGLAIIACFQGALAAVIIAGTASPISTLSVTTEKKGLIADPPLKAAFDEATFGRYLFDSLRLNLGQNGEAYIAKFLDSLSGQTIQLAYNEIIEVFQLPTPDFNTFHLLQKLTKAFQGGAPPKEWEETVKKVMALPDV